MCNTLQHSAAHCSSLPRTATYCYTHTPFLVERKKKHVIIIVLHQTAANSHILILVQSHGQKLRAIPIAHKRKEIRAGRDSAITIGKNTLFEASVPSLNSNLPCDETLCDHTAIQGQVRENEIVLERKLRRSKVQKQSTIPQNTVGHINESCHA